MAKKRYKPDQIVSLLRQAEALQVQGMFLVDLNRLMGISEVASYRWCKEYGEMSGHHFEVDPNLRAPRQQK